MSIRPLTDESGWSCDWGGCNEQAVAERATSDTELPPWLPVCTGHLGPQKRGPGPRGTCPVCGTDHALSTKSLIRAHNQGWNRCPGTGKEPSAPAQPPARRQRGRPPAGQAGRATGGEPLAGR